MLSEVETSPTPFIEQNKTLSLQIKISPQNSLFVVV